MMKREEILEYPYTGTITRVVEGDGKDDVITVYNGVMDEHQTTDNEGRLLQTASYIISMPLNKDDNDHWVIPKRGDKISLVRFGETISFVVDNAEPSQLGGISVYCTRKTWE